VFGLSEDTISGGNKINSHCSLHDANTFFALCDCRNASRSASTWARSPELSFWISTILLTTFFFQQEICVAYQVVQV
jgi:hypothetical protein